MIKYGLVNGLKFEIKVIKCKLCGREFERPHAATVYCSAECRHKAHLKQCEHWRFTTSGRRYYEKRKTKCKAKVEKHDSKIVTIRCICCGCNFKTYKLDQRFCSQACRSIFATFDQRMKAEKRAQEEAHAAMMERLAKRDEEYAKSFPEQAKRKSSNVEVSPSSEIDNQIVRRFA